MNRALLFAALLLSVAFGATATADPTPDPTANFDHGRHQRAFEREGLGCVACHAMGGAQTPDADADEAALVAIPAGACHYCHTDPDSTARKAPSRCETCHEQVQPPATHIAGWLSEHGAVARMRDCSDCHRSTFCIDCHERREPVRYQVHDRGWLGIHGIAVLADPAACGSCHRQDFCTACHAGGAK